jgi:MFS transporter, FSR family, fosmidomycin resistance protein
MDSTQSGPDAGRRDAEIIGLVGLAHGTSHFFHLMLPPLFPWLMKDFALSYTDVGLLTTTFFVVSGVGQAVAGFVVDRVGARRVLFFGIGALSLSGIVLGLSNSYPMLLLTAATAGAGNSIFHPADFTLLNHGISPSRLGHAFSVHGLSGSLGWALAPVFMAGTASLAGWHVAGFAMAAVGAVVMALLWWRRDALGHEALELMVVARDEREEAVKPAAPLAFLSSGAVWLCFAFFFLTTAAFGILQNYAPAILSRVYGVSLVFASGGLTAYLLGSAAGMIAGGFLASRGDRVVTVALTLSALMAMLLATGAMPSFALWLLMGALGFGVGTSGPPRDLLVRRAATSRFGRTSFGRVYGFVYSGLDTGLAVSPLLFGPLLDAGRFQDALIAVAVLQALSLFTALRVGSSARDVVPAST